MHVYAFSSRKHAFTIATNQTNRTQHTHTRYYIDLFYTQFWPVVKPCTCIVYSFVSFAVVVVVVVVLPHSTQIKPPQLFWGLFCLGGKRRGRMMIWWRREG